MTTYTYTPGYRVAGVTSVLVFTDTLLSIPATISDATGLGYPTNQLPLLDDGEIPAFQCTSAPVYFGDPESGQPVTLSPTETYSAPVPITGSKGANAALASLIAGLIQCGVPIVDQTT